MIDRTRPRFPTGLLAKAYLGYEYYTFRTSNFGSALGGAGLLGKGFTSMELA